MGEYVLQVKNLTKYFGQNRVLNHVDLSVKRGEIHGIVGANGSGKSTLMNILFGNSVIEETGGYEGEVLFEGKQMKIRSPKEAVKMGIGMIHQEFMLIPDMSVTENIKLTREHTSPVAGKILGSELSYIERKKDEEDAKRTLAQLGFQIDSSYLVKNISVNAKQFVEIAREVNKQDLKFLILDEPTSSLTAAEVEALFTIVDELRSKGVAIVYISHKMAEIRQIADDITIMRDGTYVGSWEVKDISDDEIVKQMVGRELTNRYPEKDNVVGEPLLEVKGLTAAYSALKDVSFVAKKGEVLGVAGLDGSGRTELLENIFGVATKKSGEIYLHGKQVLNRNARESLNNKFALLTEERRATGIFGIRDIQANTTISSLSRYKTGPFLSEKKLSEATEWGIKAMRTKTPSQRTQIRSLSGGNQQKVILARWLLTEPEVLLLDEPTRGIDVGAKYEIYQLILDLAKQGKSVIMVSSEMPELLGVCDRILVMSGGRLAGEVDAKKTTQEEIMTLAAKYV